MRPRVVGILNEPANAQSTKLVIVGTPIHARHTAEARASVTNEKVVSHGSADHQMNYSREHSGSSPPSMQMDALPPMPPPAASRESLGNKSTNLRIGKYVRL